jgi:hypothetical protein
MTQGTLRMGGDLGIRVHRALRAPFGWRLRNALRSSYWGGWLAAQTAKWLSRLTGLPTLTGELHILLTRQDGTRIDYGVVSYRVVTTAFVNFVVDQLQTETSVFGASDSVSFTYTLSINSGG